MKKSLFENLGFNVKTKLSEIEKSEKIYEGLMKSFSTTNFSNPVEYVIGVMHQYNSLVSLNQNVEWNSLYIIGYNYGIKKSDPSIAEIEFELKSDSYYLNTNRNLSENALSELVAQEKRELIESVSNILIKVASGSVIYRLLEYLKPISSVLEKNSEYFKYESSFSLFNRNFEEHIEMVEMIDKIKLDPRTTLAELEIQKEAILRMNEEFDAIKTPDLKKSIKDRIDVINEKLGGVLNLVNESNLSNNLYRQGYTIAIRGENPTLIQIISRNSGYITANYWRYQLNHKDEFGNNSLKNVESVIMLILQGYAYSYHLAYLESKLNLIGKIDDQNVFVNVQTTANSGKIHWKGQKNQLYDVIRQLKAQGLLANSYEDMAVYIHNSVDVFATTSLSTILKEIGKNKRPVKAKRVDINKI